MDGQCFCSGEVPSSIASRIVPTPVGGQTIKQVCARIGQGPALVSQAGVFNYPVYEDLQCGHGPFESASGPRDKDCLGTIDGTYGSCQPAGPKWALSRAYKSPAVLAAAKPGKADDESETVIATISVNSVSPVVKSPAAQSDSVAHSNSKDKSKDRDQVEKFLATYPNKSVLLGDTLYLQARAGLPGEGGAAGSRIILDGFVYLRDDEHLDVADLYVEPSVPESASGIAAATPSEQAVTAPIAQAAVDQQPESDVIVDVERTREVKPLVFNDIPKTPAKTSEEQQRIERSRAEFLADMQARDARLGMRKQPSDQNETAIAPTAHVDHQMLAVQESHATREELAKRQAHAKRWEKAEQRQLAKQRSDIESQVDSNNPPIAAAYPDETAVDEASRQVSTQPSVTPESTVLNALLLPAHTRASSRDFAYVEAMPASYDFGGNGIVLEASAQSNARFQYLGRLGVTDTYREAMIGGGYYVTPAVATRMTVVLLAGVEYGSFELNDAERAPGLSVTADDSGVYFGAMSRFVVNNKFELKGGVGYGSFFEGDATVFGGGYYHVTPRLDVMSRFEFGDNDTLGIGIRYYY